MIASLTLFILYPMAILLADSVYGPETGLTLSLFERISRMSGLRKAITNTLKAGFTVGILSTIIGLLFAYVEVYAKIRTKFTSRLFQVVSMPPVVSPPARKRLPGIWAPPPWRRARRVPWCSGRSLPFWLIRVSFPAR